MQGFKGSWDRRAAEIHVIGVGFDRGHETELIDVEVSQALAQGKGSPASHALVIGRRSRVLVPALARSRQLLLLVRLPLQARSFVRMFPSFVAIGSYPMLQDHRLRLPFVPSGWLSCSRASLGRVRRRREGDRRIERVYMDEALP